MPPVGIRHLKQLSSTVLSPLASPSRVMNHSSISLWEVLVAEAAASLPVSTSSADGTWGGAAGAREQDSTGIGTCRVVGRGKVYKKEPPARAEWNCSAS